MTQQTLAPLQPSSTQTTLPEGFLDDVRRTINQTRKSIASTVNTTLSMGYWHVGNRILRETLQSERAEYGRKIVVTLSRQLVVEYGNSFSEKNLRRMVQFAEVFPDEQIVVSLIRQLTWTHLIALIPIKDPIKREFYAEMCRIEKWNVRTLRKKMDSMLYERTALSRKPELVAKAELEALRTEDQLTPELVFRDPYILQFLNLNDHYIEKDVEDAIMRELEQFLLELGVGFCFVARQKCITVDEEDFHLDLLFFHRGLKRLIAIELKLGDFKPEHKGQMELYLRWLDKYERSPGEESPMGLILCAGKKQERIELLELGNAGIHVAEYLTSFPSREILREKLQKAIEHARHRLERQTEETPPS
jgi:predicted nuclease of restriction endonuclease-like (RecB) superfamily